MVRTHRTWEIAYSRSGRVFIWVEQLRDSEWEPEYSYDYVIKFSGLESTITVEHPHRHIEPYFSRLPGNWEFI